MSQKSFEIMEDALGHILSDNRLVVPKYQREYSWGEQEINEFLQDIDRAMVSGGEYFLGSIVVTQSKDKVISLVDGQQRLTTTAILFAVLRDYFHNAKDVEKSSGIESKFLFTKELRTGDIKPRLILSFKDHQYFLEKILKNEADQAKSEIKTESRLSLENAKSQIKSYAMALLDKAKGSSDVFFDWIEYLESSAKVVLVKVPDEAKAFMIFETLNDRGLDLAVADLLKNHLFSKAEDRLEEVQSKWIECISILSASDQKIEVLEFIKQMWSSREGATREKELFQSLRSKISSKVLAVNFVDQMLSEARLYVGLSSSQSDTWDEYDDGTRSVVDTLNLFKLTQQRPLLLAILSKISRKEVPVALSALQALAIRSIVVGTASGGYFEKIYTELAHRIFKGEVTTAKQICESLKKSMPDDSQFKSSFSTISLSRAAIARFYLAEIERYLNRGNDSETVPNPDAKLLNLEHVLPSTPGEDWSLAKDVAKKLSKRLGNMTLLLSKKNSKLGNVGFAKKKEVLASSELKINEIFATVGDWNEIEISKRQAAFADIAAKIWSI